MSTAMGTVHGSLYTKCRNAQTRMAEHLLVRFPGGSDVRTVQQVGISGIQSSPSNGSLAVMTESGPVGSLKFATATDNFAPWTIQPGEVEIFSDDGYMDTTKNPPVLAVNKLFSIQAQRNGAAWIGNVPTGKNLFTILQNLIQGIQGATCVNGSPPTDTTGKIALALSQLATVLTSVRE